MTLTEYLENSSDTAVALSERVGISPASMSRICKGKQNVTLATARRIEAETDGAVRVVDLDVPAAA